MLRPYLERIEQITEVDRDVPVKQRHLAKWNFERLQDVGCSR